MTIATRLSGESMLNKHYEIWTNFINIFYENELTKVYYFIQFEYVVHIFKCRNLFK